MLDHLSSTAIFELTADTNHSSRMIKQALGKEFEPSAAMLACCGGNAGATTACIDLVKYLPREEAEEIFRGLYSGCTDQESAANLPSNLWRHFKRHRATVNGGSEGIALALAVELHNLRKGTPHD